jgi:hypothetical protein
MPLGPYVGALLACEILGKMDHLRDYLAEKGMPEPRRESCCKEGAT